MFGDMGKLMDVMKIVGKVKKEGPAMKEKLANSTYEESVYNGAITAIVNGKMKVVEIKVGPAVDLPNAELAKYITDAVNQAQKKAADAAAEAFKELTGGMDLGGLGDML